MTDKATDPPEHLEPSTKDWWRAISADYQLEAHHLKLLQLACEAWDRTQQARTILSSASVCITDDRGNIRAHPAVAIEKDARTAFARLVREMDLDTEPAQSSRPPSLRSNRGTLFEGH